MQVGNVAYFLVWAALIFLMMRYGCGAHVMGHRHQNRTGDAPRGHGPDGAEERAVDPVCGRVVQTDTAKSSLYGGRAFYFCSSDCRAQFEANPGAYASRGAGGPAPQHEGHRHGC